MRKVIGDLSNQWLLLMIAILIALGGLVWANYTFSTKNPGGNDFLVYYTGTRAILYEGENPYSDKIAERIQNRVYGRAALEGEHELRFVYPLYSILLFSPFSVIREFTVARAAWMTVLETALFLTAYLNLRTTYWKPKTWMKGLYFVFALSWYHALRGLINGNAVLLVTFLVTLFVLAVQSERWILAGILLALATVKPHLILLPATYAIIWAGSRRRWSLVGAFLVTVTILIGGSMLILPNWILLNLWEILRFPEYNSALTLGELLGNWLPGIRRQIQYTPTILLGLILVSEWFAARRSTFNRFFWTFGLTLVVSQWIGIPTDPGNFILLFPALVIILSAWDKRWNKTGIWAGAACLGLLWIGLWYIFLSTVEVAYQPIQSPVMFLPLPAFLLLGLYWVRWWYASPVQRIVEQKEDNL